MKELRVGRSAVSLVDDDVYEWASRHNWHPSGTQGRYVSCHMRVDGRTKTVYLHRLILDAPRGLEVDHINGDPLDNRRENLRLATRAQNEQNKLPRNLSKFGRGVYFDPKQPGSRKYAARAWLNGKEVRVGRFATAEEANAAVSEFRRLHYTHEWGRS